MKIKEGKTKRFENITNHTISEKEIHIEITNCGNNESVIAIEKQGRDGKLKVCLHSDIIFKINELLNRINKKGK